MKTTVTPVDQADLDALSDSAEDATDGAEEQQERAFGPRVKLTVEVDQETFENAIEEAFRKIEIARPRRGNDQNGEKQGRGQAAAQERKSSPLPPHHETYTRLPRTCAQI